MNWTELQWAVLMQGLRIFFNEQMKAMSGFEAAISRILRSDEHCIVVFGKIT
jgi:hypothetical protein